MGAWRFRLSATDRKRNQQAVEKGRPARPQPLGYAEDAFEARTTLADFFNSLLVCGAWWFLAEPGRVLEDALRAGIVDELLAADEALLHRHLAPGAEAIGKFCQGCVRGRHARHSLRPLRTLSTDRETDDRLIRKKVSLSCMNRNISWYSPK